MMSNTMKLGALALAMLAGGASARPINDVTYYVPAYANGTYAASVNFNGATSTFATSSIENTGAPMTQLIGSVDKFYWSIRTDLTKAFADGIAASGTGASITSDGAMWGDLRMTVAGQPGGNLKLDVGGPSYSVDFKIKKSEWVVDVTCSSRVTLSNLTFTSTYNPYTGAVSATSMNYVPSQSTSCDSNFSWIPFIGNFIDNKASSLIGKAILGAAGSQAGKVLTVDPQKAFFAFTDAIQPGTNMIGGLDAGMYIKNNMQNLYVGKTVSLFVANMYKYEPSQLSLPGPTNFRGTRFAINFDDANSHVGLTVDASKNYTWVKRIIPGTNGPGGDE